MRVNKTLSPLPLKTDWVNLEKNYPAFEQILARNFEQVTAWLPVPADEINLAANLSKGLRVGDSVSSEIACVIPTSGSTGTPKGVMLTSAALKRSIEITSTVFAGDSDWVLALPPYHIAGLQVILRSVYQGKLPLTIDISDGFNPLDLVNTVENFTSQKHYISLMPNQLAKIAASPIAVAALKEFDYVLTGGAKFDKKLHDFYSKQKIQVIAGYGMSETCGGCIYDGYALPEVEMKIDTSNSQLQVRGPMLASGYRNSEKFPLTAEGWFITNDLAQINSKKLNIIGRVDNVINSAGIKIIPEELENNLKKLAYITDCAVIALKNDKYGEIAAAVIIIDNDKLNLTTPPAIINKIKVDINEFIAPKYQPKNFRLIKKMPLLSSGKVDKTKLKDLFI